MYSLYLKNTYKAHNVHKAHKVRSIINEDLQQKSAK